jgi:predicted phage terminase large subunit-like protein
MGSLTPAEIELIAKLPDDVARGLLWHAEWMDKALDHQLVPAGDWWSLWLLLAGRGAGKTRTSAETIGWWAWSMPGTRWLVSAPTYGDLVGTCFEGESGLLAVIPHELIEPTSSGALYNKTDVELRLKNGSLIKGISAENPERFRGPQFHGGWLDELAAWQRAEEAFDMLMFGMRLGDRPRIVISTTPKPKPIITRLLKREGKDVTVSRASTYANLKNLAPTFREQILQYEGTALGRQEIHAEVLDPADQGIIKRSWIQLWPADKPLPVFDLIVLSLDTAFTEATRNSKTGDADYTGCSVWGLFREDRQDGVLLLDCWQERLGMPDLIDRTKREMAVQYGDRDKPLIAPIYGAPLLGTSGRKPDLCVIEDKGSGISLRQMLAREGLQAVAYNPGRASKLERLHMVSHLFANGMVWVVESDKRPGQPRSWADPLIEQLCSFSGEKSIAHDDLVDSSTQALRVIVDKMGVSVANPREIDEYWQSTRRRANPYAA